MTINTNTKNPALRTDFSDKRLKPVYCIDNGKRWPSAVACAEDIGAHVQNVRQACNGILKTCRRLHLCYEEDVAGVQSGMSNSLVNLSTENEYLRAEVERLRAIEKAHNKRQAEEDAYNQSVAKLEKRITQLQQIYDNEIARANNVMERLLKAKQELDDLKNGRK